MSRKNACGPVSKVRGQDLAQALGIRGFSQLLYDRKVANA